MISACDCAPSAVTTGLGASHGPSNPVTTARLTTLLVVDDEEMIVTVASKSLSRMGYTILTARSGQEAIDIALSHPGSIEVVILDVDMSPMNGMEAFPHLRKARPNIRTLICSGYGRDAAVRKLLEAGADAFLSKPYLIEDLAECIQTLLDPRANQTA